MSTITITFDVISTITVRFSKDDFPKHTEKEFINDAKNIACQSLATEKTELLWGRPDQKWVDVQSKPQDYNIDDDFVEVVEE